MTERLRWGILGSGRIAGTFAEALQRSPRAILVGIASRTAERPEIRERFSNIAIFGSYEALLDRADIDVVYIGTNHSSHVKLAKLAALSGKHVVCEKPAGVSADDARDLFATVRSTGVFFMEAFMYRLHPQIRKAIDLVADGEVGDLKLIRAAFGFRAANPASRLFNANDYGGGILDAGGYPLSIARLFAGVAAGKPFQNPTELVGLLTRIDGGVDDLALASLKFPGDILAQVSVGIAAVHGQIAQLFGTKASLTITSPWFAGGIHGGKAELVLARHGEGTRIFEIHDQVWLYEHEVNLATECITKGIAEPPWPAVTMDDCIGNMESVDRWLAVDKATA